MNFEEMLNGANIQHVDKKMAEASLFAAEEDLRKIDDCYTKSLADVKSIMSFVSLYLSSIIHVEQARRSMLGLEKADNFNLDNIIVMTYKSDDYPIKFFEALVKSDESNISSYFSYIFSVKDKFKNNQKEIINELRSNL